MNSFRERAKRLQQNKKCKEDRIAFLTASGSMKKGEDEVKSLLKRIELVVKTEISDTGLYFRIRSKFPKMKLVICNHELRIKWITRNADALRDCYLYVEIRRNQSFFEMLSGGHQISKVAKYAIDIDKCSKIVWRGSSGGQLTIDQLAFHLLDVLMSHAEFEMNKEYE